MRPFPFSVYFYGVSLTCRAPVLSSEKKQQTGQRADPRVRFIGDGRDGWKLFQHLGVDVLDGLPDGLDLLGFFV